jgi:hypothetical protein
MEIPLDDVDPTDYGGQEDEAMEFESHSIHGLIAPIQRLTVSEMSTTFTTTTLTDVERYL